MRYYRYRGVLGADHMRMGCSKWLLLPDVAAAVAVAERDGGHAIWVLVGCVGSLGAGKGAGRAGPRARTHVGS